MPAPTISKMFDVPLRKISKTAFQPKSLAAGLVLAVFLPALSDPPASAQFISLPDNEPSDMDRREINSSPSGITVHVMNKSLLRVLQKIQNESGVLFEIPKEMANATVTARFRARDWTSATLKLLEDFSRVEVWEDNRLSWVRLLNKGVYPQSLNPKKAETIAANLHKRKKNKKTEAIQNISATAATTPAGQGKPCRPHSRGVISRSTVQAIFGTVRHKNKRRFKRRRQNLRGSRRGAQAGPDTATGENGHDKGIANPKDPALAWALYEAKGGNRLALSHQGRRRKRFLPPIG